MSIFKWEDVNNVATIIGATTSLVGTVVGAFLQRLARSLIFSDTLGMKPYSKDLRLRVLAAVDRGVPTEEVEKTFSVSVPSIKRWLKLRKETGDLESLGRAAPVSQLARAQR